MSVAKIHIPFGLCNKHNSGVVREVPNCRRSCRIGSCGRSGGPAL